MVCEEAFILHTVLTEILPQAEKFRITQSKVLLCTTQLMLFLNLLT
jgi:hypothetical protein